ncbi:hypothetical protein [Nioella sp. MMSF_3534]|uniref:hypothetical protein n=1 Tax=Nioella sp. MMSF_3534 TaxID=3046720 RepID=UPI00273EF780|nr:hypothetical protein [Nioella sp. MMSF_3534]
MSIDPELVRLAFQAVKDPRKWENLLRHLISVTPAKAAIITLRDKKTCQIVNDDALEAEYHSPLIQGFDFKAVAFYMTELRTIDPWAKAQIQAYPHIPTVMSRIVDPRTASDRRFFEWLERAGLRDTIAFELDRMPGHWTAINLFLPEIDTPATDHLMSYCKAHAEILREAWQSSQYVMHCQQSGQAALDHLSQHSVPACILSPGSEVALTNDAFRRLKDEGIAKVSQPSGRISLCLNASFKIEGHDDDLTVLRHAATDSDVTVSAVPFEPDPLYSMKKEKHWLLRFEIGTGAARSVQSIGYPLERLTPQERRLFEAISQGVSVQEGGQMLGIQRSRTYEVWSRVKEKLGISNAHELRGLMSVLA